MTRKCLNSWFSLLLAMVMLFTANTSAVLAMESEPHTHEEEITESIEPSAEIEVIEEDAVVEEVEVPEETESVEEIEKVEEPENSNLLSGTIENSAINWTFDAASGRLTISGSGDCATFRSASDQPWAAFRTSIREVWFNNMADLAISNLAYWFYGCSELTTAEVPYTTPVIGKNAFGNCESLSRVMLYYENESFTIAEDAFYIKRLTPLEVAFIPGFDSTTNTLYNFDWRNEHRVTRFTDVYDRIALASAYCPYCNATRSYTYEYVARDSDIHYERMWCSSCGLDMNEGVIFSEHSYMDYGDYLKCTDCGYKLEGSVSCSHTSTKTTWDGCEWSEYCRSCGELLDTGISHGRYSYGEWTYYNSSRHRSYYSCNDCGEGSYEYASHSTTTSYDSYSDTQHSVSSYCSTCSSYIGSTTYANHSFSYGSWSNYSATQHRRTKTCSTCGYSTYEYASHSLNYGSWASYSDTQHRRSVSCSCGYSTYEYVNHTITYGSWKSSSATQHSRTKSCSCGYSGTETAAHSLTNGKWSSTNATTHTRSKTCSCGYSTTESAAHGFVYGKWTAYSEEQHSRTISCECGYSSTGYGTHADANDDGTCDDCSFLMTRFSVTVPASLTLTLSKWGEMYAAENAQIINNSTDAVKVTGIKLTANNGWTLVPYSTNMATAKVDSKLIGFRINAAQSARTGSSESLTLGNNWSIAKGANLHLDYDAVVSASSAPINEQVLTIVFYVDWAA